MADRLVYFGEFKNHKKEELTTKAIDMLKENKGKSFYYLLPNGSLLKDYREKFVRESGAAFELNLFTFDDIVKNIVKDSEYLLIDNIWKSFLIRQLLEDLSSRDKIRHYKSISSKQGFIESISFIIGEIKRSLVSPESFIEKSPRTVEFEEIGLIYEEYESYMEEEKLMDIEGSYLKALELLKLEKNKFQDLDFIIIDEFYDFRPIEIEILKLMEENEFDIYINMPFKMDYDSLVVKDTLESLVDLGFEIEPVEERKDDFFMELGRGFFDYRGKKFKPTNKLSLIESPSRYLEIKKVFSTIRKLHASGNRLDRMGIVLLSEKYKEELISISIEEKIPLGSSIQMRLIKIPFVRELLILAEDKYKSLAGDLDIDPVDSFENYHGIFLDLIEKNKIDEKIKNTYLKTDDFNIYKRDLLAFDKLLSILREIEKLEPWKERLSFSDYLDIISAYLEEEKIYLKDENLDGINIMNPLNARGFEYDHIFVLGLSQGEYPVLKSNNFLIRDEHGEALKNIGIKYWNYAYRLDNELVKFASLLSNADRGIYLSYSSEDQAIPSIFLEEIVDRFEGEDLEEKLNYIKLELDYIFKNKLEEISTQKELANYLLLNLDKDMDGKADIFSYYNHFNPSKMNSLNEKITCEHERSQDSFNEYSGKISDKAVAKKIRDLHRDQVYSATYLESYSKCPFAFFMKNILDLEEDVEEDDYSALDIGSIYHEVLRYYYTKYKDHIEMDIREKKPFDIGATLDYLKNDIEEQAGARELDLKKKSSRLVLDTIYMNLKRYIEHDILRLKEKKDKMMPLEFEVEFGISSSFSLDIDGKIIEIMGRIDRIDKVLDEEKYIVIDYKSGSSGIYGLEDIREGLSLQMPIYILSQRQKNIVLGIYGQIKAAKSQVKIGVVDQVDTIRKSNSAAITSEEREELLALAKENIKEIVDGIERADFSVNPKECSSYCPYKGICRYNSLVEVEI